MAALGDQEAQNLITCPVCLDRYRDPRMLRCAHQFCLACLEGLARTSHSLAITCPTCRSVTHPPRYSSVAGLPRPVLMIQAQQVIEGVLANAKQPGTNNCDMCDLTDVAAAKYCYECRDTMCQQCYTDHQQVATLAAHHVVRACAELFCTTHASVQTAYCTTCKACVCKLCMRKEHREHNLETLALRAQRDRIRLTEFVSRTDTAGTSWQNAEEMLQEINVPGLYDEALKKLDKGYDVLKNLYQLVQEARLAIRERKSASVNKLRAHVQRLQKAEDGRNRTVAACKRLLSEGGDQEVIAKAEPLLDNPLPSPADVATPDLTVPSVKGVLEQVVELVGDLKMEDLVDFWQAGAARTYDGESAVD